MAIQHGIVEKMEWNYGKLFIGGISWDTDEDRLREYFSSYGEVVETMIMRDRLTGRARGFGFVVFADPVVAERVVMEKHMIDGRMVEAKKAVPRDDHHGLNRNNGSTQGSPGPGGKTKKIFVGGLASAVTESDFKKYFDQFGTVTDVVVMYDHNTQRPRGFGFITYDSEEAVDRVLHKTFHELNGKMVEVKRAVPKELSPGPSHSPLVGYNYGLGRPNTFLTSGYPQGYSMSSIGGYGVSSPTAGSRTELSPFTSAGYGMGMNLEPVLHLDALGGTSNFSNNMGYGRALNPYYGGNSNRCSTPIGYNQGNGRSESLIGTSNRSVWGNRDITDPASSGTCLDSGSGGFGVFRNNGASWGSSVVAAQGGGSSSSHSSGNIGGFGGGENNYVLAAGGLGRNNGADIVGTTTSFNASSGNLFRGRSMYGHATWQSPSNELHGFDYGLDSAEEVMGRTSEGYVGNYSIANRQPNRVDIIGWKSVV